MTQSIQKQSHDRTQNWGTLDVTPQEGEMIKPFEVIDIVTDKPLSLTAKKSLNKLLHNAHGADLRQEDKDFTIALSELTGSHNGNDRIDETIETLMKTIAKYKNPDGSVTRFQLLGGNNMGDPTRTRGELVYRFDKELIKILKNSALYGKLELAVMDTFKSKYALNLYENISKVVNLRNKWSHEYQIDEFRQLLDVGEGKYKAFGSLKQRCIDPAIKEVNSWAAFDLDIKYGKTGQKVTKVIVSWIPKDRKERFKIRQELEKSKIGREVRMRGQEDVILNQSNDDLLIQGS